MAQVVEHLHSKLKALSANTSTKTKTKTKHGMTSPAPSLATFPQVPCASVMGQEWFTLSRTESTLCTSHHRIRCALPPPYKSSSLTFFLLSSVIVQGSNHFSLFWKHLLTSLYFLLTG
jgi:hypothetical protein